MPEAVDSHKLIYEAGRVWSRALFEEYCQGFGSHLDVIRDLAGNLSDQALSRWFLFLAWWDILTSCRAEFINDEMHEAFRRGHVDETYDAWTSRGFPAMKLREFVEPLHNEWTAIYQANQEAQPGYHWFLARSVRRHMGLPDSDIIAIATITSILGHRSVALADFLKAVINGKAI